MKTKPDENRLYWIDAIRSFACLCVVLVHSIPKVALKDDVVAPLHYLIVAGASVLFFMISGALVFYKPKPFVPFIKRRLSKIVLPMMFWTVLVLIIECLRHDMDWSALPRALMLMPFTPQYGTYWFIYVIFGIYLLTPMVATWLEKCSRTDVLILLIVGCIAMTVPYLRIIDKDFSKALYSETGSLYYFVGYLWICLMGYYIRRYVNIPKFRWWHVLVLLLVLAMPSLLRLIGEPYALIQKRTTINVVLLCACYFIIIKHIKLSDYMKKVVYIFAQHSFGIYLVHNLVNDFLLKPLLSGYDLHYGISIPLVFVLNLIISYVIVHLISKLPFSDYLIAYNS
jgi:surface polysaccharide O-acyltransferase-like enzyme